MNPFRMFVTAGLGLAVGCADTRDSRGQTGGTGAGSADSSGSGADDTAGGSGTSASSTSSGSSTGSGTSGTSSTGSSGSSGGDVRFDVATGDVPRTSEGGGGVGCSKVDFLSVVDNSGSMAAEQQNLANSFPGFIAAIQNNLELEDFHIMVLDTDAAYSMGGCVGNSVSCSPSPSCCASACVGAPCGATCNGLPCPGQCDSQLGAGRFQDQDGNDCGVTGGIGYMVPSQPDLNGTFACLAQVGTLGNGNEQQAGAMVTALGPAMLGPGGCNEGFLRNDAILVVTIITDEEDGPEAGGTTEPIPDTNSPGNAATWKQALVDAKHGDETAIVMLGVVGDLGTPGAICQPFSGVNGAENCQQLREFADSFTYGQWASVCAPDYTPFFAEAVSVIDSACDVFVPPG